MNNEQNMKVSVFVPEARTIDIVDQNDKLLGTFEVQKDEIDLMERFTAIQGRTQKKDFKDNVNEQVALITETRSFIDEILGEGALKKITGGKSIGLAYTMRILEMVISELMRVSTERIAADYE